MEMLSGAHAKGAKTLNGFKFGTFIGRFPSDSAASMAVKGLKHRKRKHVYLCTCTQNGVQGHASSGMARTDAKVCNI